MDKRKRQAGTGIRTGEALREALENSKKELTRLVSFPELNPNPVVEVDSEGRVSYLNPAAKQLLPDLQTFGCHEGWLAHLEPLAERVKNGSSRSHVREIKIGDNWYEQKIYFVPENNHIRIYGYNISDRKRMEEEISKAYDGLERRVQERTGELIKVNERLEVKIAELKQAKDALFEQSRIPETFFTSTVTPLVFLDRSFNFIRVNDAYARVCKRKASDFPGHNHFEFYPSDTKAIFEQVVETRVPYQAIARPFAFPDHQEWGTTYWDWTLTPIVNTKGDVEFLVFSLNDVTERKENENRIKSTNTLLELFSKKSHKREYFEAVVNLLQGWSECRCVGIRVLDERGTIPYEAYTGFSPAFWESENGLMVKQDSCICTRVVTGNPDPNERPMMTAMGSFRCDDAPRFFHCLSPEGQANYRGKCVQYGFSSVAVIPIRYQDHVLGIIHLADESRGKVPFRVVEFIESMAPLIGEAANRFRLEEEIRESENRLRRLSSQLLSVQEKERKRVAQEIHDGIGQMLTAVKFKIENVLHSSGKMGEKEQPLESVIPMIQGSIEEVRRIQMDLRPSTLDDLGFLATLAWFTREFEKIYFSIRIEKQIDVEEQEIPPPLKTVFFRIMQEAMNNISKHSKADHVRLSLKNTDGRMELTIQDNGVGFDPDRVLDLERTRRGFGLSSMKERAEFSGGSLTIDSAKGKGTTIRAEWPLQ